MSKNRGYGDRCSTQDPRFLTVHPAEIPLRNTVSDPASEALWLNLINNLSLNMAKRKAVESCKHLMFTLDDSAARDESNC